MVEVAGPKHGEHRPEDLVLAQRPGGVDVGEHVRPHEPAAVGEVADVCRHDLPRGAAADVDEPPHAVAGLLVHERPEAAGRIGRGAHMQAPHGACEPGHEGVVHVVEHDHPRARGALLALEAKRALGHRHDRLVEVGVVIHDDRVLAPHLRDHPLHQPRVAGGRRLRGEPVDRQAHVPRAGEGDERRVGMGHERGTDQLAAAGQEGEGRRRRAGLHEDVVELLGDERRLLRRLHHHRVAGDERGGRHPGEDRERKVPGRDHHAHAPRQEAGGVFLAGHVHAAGREEVHRLPGVVVAEVDRLGDVGVGLPPGFADLEHHRRGELVAAGPHDGGRRVQHVGAAADVHRPPGRKRRLGHGHRPLGVGHARERHLRHRLPAIRRVLADERVGGGDLGAGDHHRHPHRPLRECRGQPIDRVLHRAAVGLDREVGERFVREGVRIVRRVVRRLRLAVLARRRSRRREQRVCWNVLDEARTEKRVVRRVFEQAADEIRHAGHELAVGHVDPHPPAGLRDGLLLGVAHAVEHLHLDRAAIEAEVFGHGHAVGERAEVVAAERRPQHVGMLHHEGGGGLVAGVGLPLLLPHRDRPAGGLGVDRLVVPVGALHEPDPHGRAAVPRPGGERGEVAGRLVEVALHHDAAVRPVAKLRLHRDLLEDLEGEILRRVALHVDVDLGPGIAGEPPEGTQPREHAVGRAHGIDGVEPAVERRELERHVHPRQLVRPAIRGGAVVHERIVRPAGGLWRKFGEQPRVGGGVGVGLGLARDRLAQEVEREAPVAAALGDRGLRGFGRSGAGDEAAGLREHRGPHRAGGERGEDAGAGGLERHPDRGREAVDRGVVDVFAEVAIDGGGVVEHRHAVHEPEEADLQIVVGGGPLAGLFGPVIGRHHRGPCGEGGGEQVTADRLHAGLDPLAVGGAEPGGQERFVAFDAVGCGRRARGRHGESPF